MGRYMTTTTLDLVMVGVNFSATDMSTLASKAVGQAEAEVDKYLSKRYDLSAATFQTSTSIPPIVTQLAERIAEGYMWQWMSRGAKDVVKKGQDLVTEAKENLADIRDYKMDVVDSTGAVVADSSTTPYRVQCNTSDYTPTFAEDDETKWKVDADKLEDIASDRDN